MALVAVKFLNDTTRNGVNVIEDWYLAKDAVLTSLTDVVGRPLYLVGDADACTKESRRIANLDDVVFYEGATFFNASQRIKYDIPVVSSNGTGQII